jgi:hypothetical protein
MPVTKLIAQIRAKIKPARRLKGLGWQTALRGHIERQRLFRAVANQGANRRSQRIIGELGPVPFHDDIAPRFQVFYRVRVLPFGWIGQIAQFVPSG